MEPIAPVDDQAIKKRKSLADYFPEEHILVTSGIVLFLVSMISVVPSLRTIGFLPVITLGKLPESTQAAGIPTDWLVWAVMGVVIIVMWVASTKKAPE